MDLLALCCEYVSLVAFIPQCTEYGIQNTYARWGLFEGPFDNSVGIGWLSELYVHILHYQVWRYNSVAPVVPRTLVVPVVPPPAIPANAPTQTQWLVNKLHHKFDMKNTQCFLLKLFTDLSNAAPCLCLTHVNTHIYNGLAFIETIISIVHRYSFKLPRYFKKYMVYATRGTSRDT